LDPLWWLAEDVRGFPALIVARRGLDLMCGPLLRRGCLAATVLRPGDKADAAHHAVATFARIRNLWLHDALLIATNRVPLKAVLAMLNLVNGEVRLPLTERPNRAETGRAVSWPRS
jgi:hypothetical protein